MPDRQPRLHATHRLSDADLAGIQIPAHGVAPPFQPNSHATAKRVQPVPGATKCAVRDEFHSVP